MFMTTLLITLILIMTVTYNTVSVGNNNIVYYPGLPAKLGTY